MELYALTVGILLFADRFQHKRIVIFCDNQSVIGMINNSSSTCKRCMILIRIITLVSIKLNVRIFARYVESAKNSLADALSRNDLKRFWELAPKHTERLPRSLPIFCWPVPKNWLI